MVEPTTPSIAAACRFTAIDFCFWYIKPCSFSRFALQGMINKCVYIRILLRQRQKQNEPIFSIENDMSNKRFYTKHTHTKFEMANLRYTHVSNAVYISTIINPTSFVQNSEILAKRE